MFACMDQCSDCMENVFSVPEESWCLTLGRGGGRVCVCVCEQRWPNTSYRQYVHHISHFLAVRGGRSSFSDNSRECRQWRRWFNKQNRCFILKQKLHTQACTHTHTLTILVHNENLLCRTWHMARTISLSISDPTLTDVLARRQIATPPTATTPRTSLSTSPHLFIPPSQFTPLSESHLLTKQ